MSSKRKASVPTSIKALYTTYEVVVTNLNEHNVEPDAPLYGKVDWERQLIFLDENQSEDVMRETLWHEIKHIAWTLGGLPKSLYYGGTTDEEDVVARLSTMEITMLKDNPGLVDYLVG